MTIDTKKPKTEIIPDQVLSVVFQRADSQLGRADELLKQRDALSEYQPSVTNCLDFSFLEK